MHRLVHRLDLGVKLLLRRPRVVQVPVVILLQQLLVLLLEIVRRVLERRIRLVTVQLLLHAVLRLDALLLLRILFGKPLGLLHHPLNLFLGQTALVIRDRNLLRLARRLFTGRHIQNAVSVHIEHYLDLWHTTGHRGDAFQLELTQQGVVLRHGALTLKHLDHDPGLVVRIRRKNLRLLDRNRAVAVDYLGHDSTRGLETQAEGAHIQEEQVRNLGVLGARQDGSLDSRTVSHALVGVD